MKYMSHEDLHLTIQIRVLEKLIVTHLVKKFAAFYGTQGFITAFTRAHQFWGPVKHLITSWIFAVRSC